MSHFHLFVYGTLLERERRVDLLDSAARVRSASVQGTLYDLGTYPALVLAGADDVDGELWRCPAPLLGQLDRYEAVRERLFRRVGHRVAGTPAWTYVAGPALAAVLGPARRIASGRWNGARKPEPRSVP